MEVKIRENIMALIDENESINIVSCGINSTLKKYLIIIKKDGTIMFACNNFNEIMGYDTTNKNISEVLSHRHYYEDIRRMMMECIFTSKQVSKELFIFDKYYSFTSTPIIDINDNIKYILMVAFDITKDKKILEEVEILKEKINENELLTSTFLANMSHELKTPMNSIVGMSELLIESHDEYVDQCKNPNREMNIKFIKSINVKAKYLDEMLSNILDVAKMEINKFDILYESFTISELFMELNDILFDINYKKNLNLVKLEFIIIEDKKIVSDYLRLKQVLFNIINNAIKFTEKGYIKISFESNNNIIKFIVEDTGIGISKSDIKNVFNRFWQKDNSSKKESCGVGLGLPISKSIVEYLGGDISLESTLNKGTTFYIKLPYDEIKQENTNKNNRNRILFSNKTVLIVDELPLNYSLLSLYLNYLKINVIAAFSGREAIDICKKNNIDLIFVDMNLPDMDGAELIKRLKSLTNIKIISKSGKNQRNTNSDYHLKKPIKKDELLLILNEIWK